MIAIISSHLLPDIPSEIMPHIVGFRLLFLSSHLHVTSSIAQTYRYTYMSIPPKSKIQEVVFKDARERV
jgi:hypothetical protein